ncbi:MAG: DUF6129 family protein [Thiocapsa sp.]|jgi:hypothetical protein|nr:DUF6129 family protein [Thiocapsa sp.]MCG6897148.1 DUF6129 family protein [Thiocapsa sp.]MCG6986157.1 DUF6129 family protein [Thiocapsa sp.]
MIPEERLDQITAVVRRAGLSDVTLAALREAFHELHFTYCRDDEITVGAPVRTSPGLRLYLVDGRDHCPVLTNDPASATGVVLAHVEDEDAP